MYCVGMYLARRRCAVNSHEGCNQPDLLLSPNLIQHYKKSISLGTEASVGFKMKKTLVVLLTIFTLTTSTWPHKPSLDKRYVIRRGNHLRDDLSPLDFRTVLDYLKMLQKQINLETKKHFERIAKNEVNPDEIQDLISRPLGVFRDF